MQYDKFWKNKQIIARNTMKLKEKLYGIDCKVSFLYEFNDIYGEESPQKTYETPRPMKLIFTGITGNNMLTRSQLLALTEQDDIYLKRFEEEALPRNTRIYLFQGVHKTHRILEVRDTVKNEGTYIVLQKLVPQLADVIIPNAVFGRNIV